MAHFLETATIEELDDLAERLSQSLSLGAFSDRELKLGDNDDDGALATASEQFTALLQRLRAERGLIPLPLLNIIVGSGFMKPEDAPLLGFVQLAPAVVVSTEALRWNTLLREFVYVTETGGIRRLNRAIDFFCKGTDEDGWSHVDQPDGSQRLQRTALELETILSVMPAEPGLSVADCARQRGLWKVVDAYGRWLLFDRHTATKPVFDDEFAATRAADAGLLGEEDRFRWFDKYNADDPSCS